jgi:hypothetical protein
MSTPDGRTMNAQTAAGLHERLREATLAARAVPAPGAGAAMVARRRVNESSIWRLFDELYGASPALDTALSCDRALRRILVALLENGVRPLEPVPLPAWAGRVLIVRSGPWPVLQALVDRLKTQAPLASTTVVCHRRDQSALQGLAATLGVELKPLFYPRFEPFNRATLARILAVQPRWSAMVVLDGARNGSGRALEHVTSALLSCSGDRFVWNASGQLYRLLPLKEALGREQYDLVRRLLRWHTATRRPSSRPAREAATA